VNSYLGVVYRNAEKRLVILSPHDGVARQIEENEDTQRYDDLPEECYEVVYVRGDEQRQVLQRLGRMTCCAPPSGTKVQAAAMEWPTPAHEMVEEKMHDHCARLEFIQHLHDCLRS